MSKTYTEMANELQQLIEETNNIRMKKSNFVKGLHECIKNAQSHDELLTIEALYETYKTSCA